MKRKYEEPEVELIALQTMDVITTSGGSGDDNEAPGTGGDDW